VFSLFSNIMFVQPDQLIPVSSLFAYTVLSLSAFENSTTYLDLCSIYKRCHYNSAVQYITINTITRNTIP
jgi:hypothetical protein